MWQTLWAWCRRSATIAWARAQMALGILATSFLAIVDLIDAAGIKESLSGLLDPKWLAVLLVALGLVTELARRRTLPKKEGA